MDKAVKIQLEIQPSVCKALQSGDYSYIFEALNKVNKTEGERNGREEDNSI